MKKLVLASQSQIRRKILKDAGVVFESDSADIDERALEQNYQGSVKDLALLLASQKALNVSNRLADTFSLGCDQTLEFDNKVLHKPENLDVAAQRLLSMSGKSHYLHSALSLAFNGKTIWTTVETACLTMRSFDENFVNFYITQTGPAILSSVGAYQIEGMGIQLFESIDGDYFTIIGLPILPLLKQLRELGIIHG